MYISMYISIYLEAAQLVNGTRLHVYFALPPRKNIVFVDVIVDSTLVHGGGGGGENPRSPPPG